MIPDPWTLILWWLMDTGMALAVYIPLIFLGYWIGVV